MIKWWTLSSPVRVGFFHVSLLFIVTHTGFCGELEVVTEFCRVTLLCCDDAKALLADYYTLCIVISFKPQKSSTQ